MRGTWSPRIPSKESPPWSQKNFMENFTGMGNYMGGGDGDGEGFPVPALSHEHP